MSKTLLARLLGTGALASAATAVAAGGIELSADQTASGENEMARLVGLAADDGHAAGVTAERERWGAVLSNDLAASNMGLAITLLSTTANTPDQIAAAMAANKAPAAAAAPAAPAPTAPAALAPTEQPLADDPLARTTPLVDTGSASANANDDSKVDHLASWNQSFTNEASAITRGGFAVAGTRPAA